MKDFLPTIRHVHMKDYDGGEHYLGYTPLGLGKVDIAGICDLLESSGNDLMIMASSIHRKGSPHAARGRADQQRDAPEVMATLPRVADTPFFFFPSSSLLLPPLPSPYFPSLSPSPFPLPPFPYSPLLSFFLSFLLLPHPIKLLPPLPIFIPLLSLFPSFYYPPPLSSSLLPPPFPSLLKILPSPISYNFFPPLRSRDIGSLFREALAIRRSGR